MQRFQLLFRTLTPHFARWTIYSKNSLFVEFITSPKNLIVAIQSGRNELCARCHFSLRYCLIWKPIKDKDRNGFGKGSCVQNCCAATHGTERDALYRVWPLNEHRICCHRSNDEGVAKDRRQGWRHRGSVRHFVCSARLGFNFFYISVVIIFLVIFVLLWHDMKWYYMSFSKLCEPRLDLTVVNLM